MAHSSYHSKHIEPVVPDVTAKFGWERLADGIRSSLEHAINTPGSMKKVPNRDLYVVGADGVRILVKHDHGQVVVLSVVTERELEAFQVA